jgi:cyclopropane-fatty-acyl-phospholipid synthase
MADQNQTLARFPSIAATRAEQTALNHYLQAADVTPAPSTLGRLFGKALGIHQRGDTIELRHPLIPTSASVAEHKRGSFTNSVIRGSITTLASYARGEWTSEDLYAVSQYLLHADRIVSLGKPLAFVAQRKHYPRSHRQSESSLHYDLPSRLFSTITEGLSYSAIRWRFDPLDAHSATDEHYERIIGIAGTQSGGVLDLGCGWGAFADFILRRTQLDITCVTLSVQQFRFLQQKYSNEPRTTALLQDFRLVHELPDRARLITLFESIEHLSVADRSALLGALRKKYPEAWLVLQTTCRSGFAPTLRSATQGALNSVVFPGPGTLATRRELVKCAEASDYNIVQEQDMSAEYAYSALVWAHRLTTQRLDDTELPPVVLRSFVFYLNSMAASLACQRVTSNLFVLKPRS